MKKNNKNISLEVTLKQLDHIVDTLELDETNIEQTIKLYKEGVDLIKSCEKQIKVAEKQIKILMKENENFIEISKDEI